jgi:predicted transposase YdaD
MRARHDELFRLAFGNPERARELVRVALPKELTGRLDLRALRITPGTFLDRKLRLSQSDLLLEASSRGGRALLVYILFEHKSSPDRRTSLQLLRYMVGIWETWSSRKENRNWRQLPPIIPVIFSHAERRWMYPLEFSALVRQPKGMDLRELTPRFRPLLLDLTARGEGELGAETMVSALLRIFKHATARSTADLGLALEQIKRLGPSERDQGLMQAVLTYLLRARQGKSVRSILEAVPDGGLRGDTMTIAESLIRKGRRQGRLEGELKGELKGRLEGELKGKREGELKGKLEGELKGKREVLARLVERKFGLTDQERTALESHTDADELDAAIDAVLSARSKAAVLKHLS